MRARCVVVPVFVGLAACQHSDLTQQVFMSDPLGLSVIPSNVSMAIGTDTTLRAVRGDTTYSAERSTWTTSDTLVATVSPQGIVHARRTGTVTIIATSKVDPTVAGAAVIAVR